MEKFTKGEWIAQPQSEPERNPFSQIEIVSAEGFYICDLNEGLGDEIVQANADLIAAAPDLYRALDRLTLMARAWQEDFSAMNRNSPDYDPNYKSDYNQETLEAMAALKKARGEK